MSSELKNHVVRSTREEAEREAAHTRARAIEPAGVARGVAEAATWGGLPRAPGATGAKGDKDKGKGKGDKDKKKGAKGAAEWAAPGAEAA